MMIWNTWVKDPVVMHLERQLQKRGVSIIKMNDYVLVGSKSKDKIYTKEKFISLAAKIFMTGETTGERENFDERQEPSVSIAEIEQTVAKLTQLAKRALQERDVWRLRATEAEARLAAAQLQGTEPNDSKYAQVKRLIARALHPDTATNSMEKAVRAEIFKQIWPQVEQIGNR